MLQMLCVSILIILIDMIIGYKGWSLIIGIPIIAIIANLTMLILTIVSHKKYIRYAIYQLIILLISVIPVILITEEIVKNPVLGEIATGISILNLIITMALCAKDVKEAIIRKFHL